MLVSGIFILTQNSALLLVASADPVNEDYPITFWIMRDPTNDYLDTPDDIVPFSNRICKTMPAHDIVTCIAFDPSTGTQFAVGTCDNTVRIYDMVTNRVVTALPLSYQPISICFLNDRKTLIIGSHTGMCYSYTNKDEYMSQESFKCSNTNVSLTGGNLVRSITFLEAEKKYLISTNDSRIRLFSKDFVLERKYKGHKSKKLPLKHSYYKYSRS
jgi:WD40 repeat protein